MDVNVHHLSSWKITSKQPFYPIDITCIGNDDKVRAVTTYAAHTVNTFIFRNFGEDMESNKPAHRSYLHKSFFPEHIIDIAVGTNESAILTNSGHIKYFTSSKNLMTVEYLSGVKSICATRNGFALIKTSFDGTEFFVDFHPGTFQDNEPDERGYNISFEKIIELQNTWHQCRFKIKELQFIGPSVNQFLRTIIPNELGAVNENNDSFLFLAIDNSFCSIHIIDEKPVVNPIVMCTTKIVDFWSGKNSDNIILLLESGTLEILYLNSGETTISKWNFYFGSEIQSYHYHEGLFMFSNGLDIEYGLIEFKKEFDVFKLKRKSIALSGIVAMTYLVEFKKILCVSENCHFFLVSIRMEEKIRTSSWIEIDRNIQKQLSNVKYQLIELSDAFDNLVDEQKEKQRILHVVKLKRNDMEDIENDIGEIRYRFVAACTVTQNPSIQRHHESHLNMIYISNSLVYDRTTSFFVTITICYTVRYANEFNANLWSLCCRWLNDKHENVYVNVKLNESQLSQAVPLTLVIHLQQKQLPCFHVNISTAVRAGNSVHLNFPVRVDQPDYCEMMNVSMSQVDQASIEKDGKSLVCSVLVPKSVPLDEIFAEKLNLESRTKAMTLKCGEQKMYTINLLKNTLTATYFPESETLRLVTKSADFMCSFKKHLHRKIETKLSSLEYQDVMVSVEALKQYCSADNHLNAVLNATDINKKDAEMLQCMENVRRSNVLKSN
ncbi:uncharacterized protein LOC129568652 isoform X1 [Sitodiplosis mosellana]|uniref:uncharacterized protein LOC129568652 isoform X1 n=1 Tax=Sitodiplosis mosellana TaxID=263140 RepID=UPI00244474EC|nr:uncharacterized protein LOC129568652 isoform X1 [Sitodiplosis mosellana]